jgi:hypothetical protein
LTPNNFRKDSFRQQKIPQLREICENFIIENSKLYKAANLSKISELLGKSGRGGKRPEEKKAGRRDRKEEGIGEK